MSIRRPSTSRPLEFTAIGIGVCAISSLGGVAHGQFTPSNAPPVFLMAPTSAMGTVTNNLVLTPQTNGFVVSGQVIVSIPPGASSGILAQWTVIRRIDPGFSSSGLMTNTVLTGFSQPPPGTFGPTSGSVVTDWRFNIGSGFVGGSQSTVPMSLVNGVDSPSWTGLTAASGGSGFTWTAGFFPGAILQQQFTLFGNYTGGPGGAWIIDVPVVSEILLPCAADFDHNGQATVQDIFDFLGVWFAGGPGADFNGSGGINIQDIFDFLSAWFTGC